MPISDAAGHGVGGTVEHRRQERHELRFDARLTVADEEMSVAIDNISVGGAKLKLAAKRAIAKGTACTLTVDDLGTYPAVIAWVRGDAVGLAFEDADWRMADAIMALAMHGRG